MYVTDRQLHTTADQNRKNSTVALRFPRKTARVRKSNRREVVKMLIAKSDPSAANDFWQSSNSPAMRVYYVSRKDNNNLLVTYM